MQFFTVIAALVAFTGVFAVPAPTQTEQATLEPCQFGGFGGFGPANVVAGAADIATLGVFHNALGGGFSGGFF
ncbi:hypothetical protein PTTG_31042 [Puccinia triticina 1-1 BBBD Race 1]|uniref:Uncharacterized protein n=2 Tax=Puccinia triticina TaxID=208348 RepID=A0A180FWD7_PUCT1|nr:uncharacterized protein PtA15_14A417 [Puccinia triticina]OAV84807.1 hypothetical protein PTTG_31042 [Puccinia triticina 1-1 BBBD Race 1]WAQ91533.1 hypothetical protein PtA15_14A417 [Puccinia triticina]